jgi:tRNA modification GTPase
MCLLDAECTQALTRATTLRAAQILLEQQRGLLRRTIEQLVDAPVDVARAGIAQLLRWADFGIHLTQPWKVVVCGRPNVGKSSLINALVGYSRSIVFDQPGTTRDVVTVETAIDGWPVEFSDTAGLHESADELESAGIAQARRQLKGADLRIVVLDTSRPPTDADFLLLEEWPDVLVIAHKCDLPNEWKARTVPHAITASALTGTGLDSLTEQIGNVLVPECPAPGTPIPVCERQITELQRASESLAAGDLAALRAQLQLCLDG